MITSAKLTPEIVRRIRYIYAYDRRQRRAQGLRLATFGLRKGMADRVFLWTGIRVSPDTIKDIVNNRRWRNVKVRVWTGPKKCR